MIATSYFAKATRYPDTFRIAISRTVPDWFKPDCQLTWLAPTWEILTRYKATGDSNEYTRKYLNILLDKNNTIEYLAERLIAKERRQNVLLLCWEAPDKFCHRHLLADYLNVRFHMHIVEL